MLTALLLGFAADELLNVGFVFLLILAFATDKGAYSSAAPVAYIVGSVLGSVVQKIFLVFVVVSIFACGLVIMVTNGRLIFSMARDRRLPGHRFLSQVPKSTGGPSWATVPRCCRSSRTRRHASRRSSCDRAISSESRPSSVWAT